jgi:4-diphosphocytidyl-2-C-methyl-D-erythritol kinase
MLIDWCDELQFEIHPDDSRITREDLGVTTAASLPQQDLCIRAAHALQAATGCQQGAHIRLKKNIPSEAGMGGGSSDAATCLLALNDLWQLGLSRPALAHIGLQLGADVPFFVHGHNAWVEGIGEQLQAITLPPAHFLVIKPSLGVSTPAIFQHPNLKRDEKRAIISDFAQKPYEFGYNAMQALAQTLNPQIGQAIELMARCGLQGRMTGSGSAVFAQIDTPQAQPKLLQDLPKGWIARIVSNLQQHPS